MKNLRREVRYSYRPGMGRMDDMPGWMDGRLAENCSLCSPDYGWHGTYNNLAYGMVNSLL
jgi:hypothetical protein